MNFITNNKIGICLWSLPIDGPYGCKLAANLGFDGVQLEIGSYERDFPLSKSSVQKAYFEIAQKHNISYPSIAIRVTDNYCITESSETKEKKIVMKAIKKGIKAAKDMNIPLIMIPTFEKSDIKTDADFQKVIEAFKFACDYGMEYGITVTTENSLSVTKTVELFQKVDKPNFKLYFDTQNYYLNKGFSSPKLIKELFPYFCNQLHVKDGKNNELSGALLGEGDTDFYQSMKELDKQGYSGWFIIENYYDRKPLSSIREDPIDILKDDLNILKEILKNNQF